jgi:hypothetical protein
MPDFTPEDITIDPSEYVSACDSQDIKELVEALVEDGYIKRSALIDPINVDGGYGRLYAKDLDFVESLESLKSKRHLLTTTEEEFINSLAKRFLHI